MTGHIIRRRAFLAGSIAAGIRPARADTTPVDLALVLAVDVSRSIDETEAQLQREGYRAALTDARVVAAIKGGMLGAIAVAYVEWAGYTAQQLIIPWTRIASPDDAQAWSDRLGRSPRQSMSWTSLSGALLFSHNLLQDSPFEATRRVVDVSGDGANNNGPPAETERDKLVADGITINGLPIINPRLGWGMPPGESIEDYYRAAVIGGPGAFLIVAHNFEDFGDAIRRKLVQEIAAGPVTRSPA
jgi:hypothetical protein